MQHVLPIMYLLLSRDLDVFRVAQDQVLDEEELDDASSSFWWILDAAEARTNDLKGLSLDLNLVPWLMSIHRSLQATTTGCRFAI